MKPRRFTITALRDIPELRLSAGAVVTVDRRHPVAPVTCGGIPCMESAYLRILTHTVFLSRPSMTPSGAAPALAVTPSYFGAQHTLENLHAELEGWKAPPAPTPAARRAAVRAALEAPATDAPREPHALSLLDLANGARLARYLVSAWIRQAGGTIPPGAAA